MLRKTWSGLRHKEAREPTGFQFGVSQLMDQSGFSFGLSGSSRGGGGGGGGALERDVRSSPQAQRTATGWTSSAAGRCSSDTVWSQTARGTQEKEGDVSVLLLFFFFKKNISSTSNGARERGAYFEQSEGGHPAGPALLVLCTQHLQLLAVAPRLAGLSSEMFNTNASLLACTGRGEQIRTWRAKDWRAPMTA